MRLPWLLVALALAGCTAPPDAPPDEAHPLSTPAASTPAASTPPPSDAAPATPPTAPASPPPSSSPSPRSEPVALPDSNRTFAFTAGAHEEVERWFLVNATHRAVISLEVRNLEPVERDFAANVIAMGPNGTLELDTGRLGDGGAAFALRLAPFNHSPEDGPALVGVRVAFGVAASVVGRVYVDDESNVSTVPS